MASERHCLIGSLEDALNPQPEEAATSTWHALQSSSQIPTGLEANNSPEKPVAVPQFSAVDFGIESAGADL